MSLYYEARRHFLTSSKTARASSVGYRHKFRNESTTPRKNLKPRGYLLGAFLVFADPTKRSVIVSQHPRSRTSSFGSGVPFVARVASEVGPRHLVSACAARSASSITWRPRMMRMTFPILVSTTDRSVSVYRQMSFVAAPLQQAPAQLPYSGSPSSRQSA